MRRRLLATTAALAGLALTPAAAPADNGRFFTPTRIDGPSADVQRLGDLDVAQDGTGALTYVKRVGGVDHVFVSRLVGGAWQRPEQVDAAFATPGSQPVVAVQDGGRLVVAYVSGTALVTLVKQGTSQPYSAPQVVAPTATDPSIDLAFDEVAYVSYTVPGAGGHDVAAARKERGQTTFTAVTAPLDVDPTHDAGVGSGRSRLAVGADGVAVVAFGEAGHVFVRRVFGLTPSLAPQDANAAILAGRVGGVADTPDIDVEDDSSYAYVVFRQVFDDGRAHAVARRLAGLSWDPPVLVDGQALPGADDAGPPRVSVSGRGDGYVASALSARATGAVVKENVFNAGVTLGAGLTGLAVPVAAADESGDGIVAWVGSDGTVRGRGYDNSRASRRPQRPRRLRRLSTLAAGAVDPTAGLEAAADRAGDVAVAFTQGPLGNRSIGVGAFDRAPGPFSITAAGARGRTRRVAWTPSFELWGPIRYAVRVNGRVVGRTSGTTLRVRVPAASEHRFRVVATDRRGQRYLTRVVVRP